LGETNELLTELRSAWDEFKVAHEVEKAEVHGLGEAAAETKQYIERVNARLDEVELRFERLSLERTGKDKDPLLKAFLSWARKGVLPENTKLLRVGDDEAGGIFAPTEFVREIIEAAYLADPLVELVRSKPTKATSIQAPVKTQRALVQWDADAVDFTTETQGQKFSREEIPTHGLSAVHDIEAALDEDMDFDLEADLLSDWGRDFGGKIAAAIHSGSGVGRAKGIIDATDVEEIASGADNTLAYAGFVNCQSALKEAYRPNAVWVMSRASVGVVRKLEDTEGHLIWQPSMRDGIPGTLLGHPYRTSENMAAVADGAHSVLFGDFKQAYWLVERLLVQVQRDVFTQWPNIRLKARRRVGGQVVLPEAMKIIVCA